MNEPLVSVIVPCYKQAHLLSETLNSVLLQTYTNWECIVVNDGSPDNTTEIANSFCQKDSRIKLIVQENQGLAMSRNNGIRSSSGKYILPLDSDDLIEPTYIEKAIKYFEENPKTKIVYCEADRFDQKNEYWNLPPYSYDKEIWQNVLFCSALYKREDYDKMDGYNPNMKGGLEDWDFWLSLLQKDDIVYRIPEILFHYRYKKNSMVTETNKMREILDKRIYNNHKEIYSEYVENILYYRTVIDDQNRILNKWPIKILRKIYSILKKIKFLFS